MRSFFGKSKKSVPLPAEPEPPFLPSKAPDMGDMQLDMPPVGTGVGKPGQKKQPKGKKMWVTVLVVVLLGLAAGGVWWWLSSQSDEKTSTSQTQTANPERIRLLVAGDFIAHDSVNSAAHKDGDAYDYLPLTKDLQPVFKKTDVRFCNDPILSGGAKFGISGYPTFNSPTEFVRDMGKLGCDVVSTASNQSFDKNQQVIDATVNAWKDVPTVRAMAGLNRSQAEHDAVDYFTVKGVKFALLSYTTYLNGEVPPQNPYGVNMFSEEFASAQIKEARKNGAQIILTSIRWGTEESAQVDEKQIKIAQFLADEGVDVVLGHGPHILQPVAELDGAGGKKTTVWYSIGNFLHSQLPAETVFNGVGVIDFNTQTKEITGMRFLPTYMHYHWTAAQAKAEDLAARQDLHLYLLEDATQNMIDEQQLKTTVEEQKTRLKTTLGKNELSIPLITSEQL